MPYDNTNDTSIDDFYVFTALPNNWYIRQYDFKFFEESDSINYWRYRQKWEWTYNEHIGQVEKITVVPSELRITLKEVSMMLSTSNGMFLYAYLTPLFPTANTDLNMHKLRSYNIDNLVMTDRYTAVWASRTKDFEDNLLMVYQNKNKTEGIFRDAFATVNFTQMKKEDPEFFTENWFSEGTKMPLFGFKGLSFTEKAQVWVGTQNKKIPFRNFQIQNYTANFKVPGLDFSQIQLRLIGDGSVLETSMAEILGGNSTMIRGEMVQIDAGKFNRKFKGKKEEKNIFRVENLLILVLVCCVFGWILTREKKVEGFGNGVYQEEKDVMVVV